MMKILIVVWDVDALTRTRRRERLLHEVAPKLLEEGVAGLSMQIADEQAAVPSPNPFPLFFDRPTGLVSLWSDGCEESLLDIVRAAGFRVEAYGVRESIYTDYGGNQHAEPRNWPDGERSPGVVAVSFLVRPKRFATQEAWVERWFSTMSPISETIQPRTRYVRNVVERPITDNLPGWEGIVEECWPSTQHVTDPDLFYGASGLWQRLSNQWTIASTVMGFTHISQVCTIMTSEYLLRTPA